jgi:pimeloyl-ACP methyl ester carboxylesterase
MLFQRQFIYRRRTPHLQPHLSLQSIGGELVDIETEDGERLIAWHKPPLEGRPIVVFFHGSADSPDQRAVRFLGLTSAGLGVLAPYFRGYGGSTGAPSETGLLLDAEAIYQYCHGLYRPERIALWGFSLGGAVAVWLASRRKVGALVLEAAFTSLTDVAKHWLPLFPAQLILRDQFRANDTISSVSVPISWRTLSE